MPVRKPEFVTKKVFTVTAPMSQAVEDYRFTKRLESESDALRELVEAGLRSMGVTLAAPQKQ